ncbi:MAG: hypothetical protein ACRD2Y_13120, partial [Terriglobales bacterium]
VRKGVGAKVLGANELLHVDNIYLYNISYNPALSRRKLKENRGNGGGRKRSKAHHEGHEGFTKAGCSLRLAAGTGARAVDET